jgi:hypothetical protein
MRLIALKKVFEGGHTYSAGEEFVVLNPNRARAHLRAGNAVSADDPNASESLGTAGLRARAEALGVEVDGRWGVTRLEEEIASATQKAARRAPKQADDTGASGVQVETVERAAQPTSDAVEDDATDAHGHYRRRDMQAEE